MIIAVCGLLTVLALDIILGAIGSLALSTFMWC